MIYRKVRNILYDWTSTTQDGKVFPIDANGDATGMLFSKDHVDELTRKLLLSKAALKQIANHRPMPDPYCVPCKAIAKAVLEEIDK